MHWFTEPCLSPSTQAGREGDTYPCPLPPPSCCLPHLGVKVHAASAALVDNRRLDGVTCGQVGDADAAPALVLCREAGAGRWGVSSVRRLQAVGHVCTHSSRRLAPGYLLRPHAPRAAQLGAMSKQHNTPCNASEQQHSRLMGPRMESAQ